MEWKKVDRPPSPEFEQFQKDGLWLREHYPELKEQYPDHLVAVYQGKVVGASRDGTALLDDMEANGLPIGHIYFFYINGNDYPRVLGSSVHWPAVNRN